MDIIIGNLIKKAIKDSGLNQKELAEKMNEFPQNISNWIKKNDLPLSKYLEICQTLGINPGSLLNKEPATQELDPRIVRIMKNVSKLSEDVQEDFYEQMEMVMKIMIKKYSEK